MQKHNTKLLERALPGRLSDATCRQINYVLEHVVNNIEDHIIDNENEIKQLERLASTR